MSIRAKIRTLVGHSEKPTGLTIASPVVSYVFSVRTWLRGVDLNHRPLGYEPNGIAPLPIEINDFTTTVA